MTAVQWWPAARWGAGGGNPALRRSPGLGSGGHGAGAGRVASDNFDDRSSEARHTTRGLVSASQTAAPALASIRQLGRISCARLYNYPHRNLISPPVLTLKLYLFSLQGIVAFKRFILQSEQQFGEINLQRKLCPGILVLFTLVWREKQISVFTLSTENRKMFHNIFSLRDFLWQ